MTQILTALTPRHIVQVSDRRVVWTDKSSGEVTRQRDGYVKAVITPSFACSYTGIADLGGRDTAEWLAVTLSDHVNDLDGGVRALATTAEQATDPPYFQNRPLAIVCAGWTQRGSAVVPLLTVINKPPSGQRTTLAQGKIANGRMSCVVPAGQYLHKDELARVNRDVENLCKSDRDTARAIAQVLTKAIRHVARSPDRKAVVSEDVLITSLPRRDLLRSQLVVGALVEDFWSVTCIPAGESRKEHHGGPIIVGNKAAIQALPPGEGPPGGGIFTGSKIIRLPEREGAGLSLFILTDPPLGQAWGWPGDTSQ
ncbi:MAG TPA: hypothetical protein VKG20_13245 [Methylomirabilota bacterium]|nr:hypothetical protein [Methylomirabilota bacterium]